MTTNNLLDYLKSTMMNICKDDHIAVLMLKTNFPRYLGDIGNPGTFQQRVKYYPVDGAYVQNVVNINPLNIDLANRFVEQAKIAENDGAKAILTSCGFLFSIQALLSKSVNIPVFTSSLLWLNISNIINANKKNIKKTAIFTANSDKFSLKMLENAGIDLHDIIILGFQKVESFKKIILQDKYIVEENKLLTYQRLKNDILNHTRYLKDNHHFKNIVLECTNLSPFKQDIAKICACPVLDINQFIKIV